MTILEGALLYVFVGVVLYGISYDSIVNNSAYIIEKVEQQEPTLREVYSDWFIVASFNVLVFLRVVFGWPLVVYNAIKNYIGA